MPRIMSQDAPAGGRSSPLTLVGAGAWAQSLPTRRPGFACGAAQPHLPPEEDGNDDRNPAGRHPSCARLGSSGDRPRRSCVFVTSRPSATRSTAAHARAAFAREGR